MEKYCLARLALALFMVLGVQAEIQNHFTSSNLIVPYGEYT